MDSGFRRNDEGVSQICDALASAAGTAALCSSRAPLGRGEQAKETARRGARMDARAFAQGTRTCPKQTPQPARAVAGHGCPATAAARVSFSLVTFFWTSKRKSL